VRLPPRPALLRLRPALCALQAARVGFLRAAWASCSPAPSTRAALSGGPGGRSSLATGAATGISAPRLAAALLACFCDDGLGGAGEEGASERECARWPAGRGCCDDAGARRRPAAGRGGLGQPLPGLSQPARARLLRRGSPAPVRALAPHGAGGASPSLRPRARQEAAARGHGRAARHRCVPG